MAIADVPLVPQNPDKETLFARAGISPESLWPHRVALFATVFTWPLIFVGGLVTTYRVGMAVPDWPTTFGINMFIYNFWNAAWGVFIEHGHRLYGAAVGVSTLILTIWFLAADNRRHLKILGVIALLSVIAQGVLGGYRVRLNSTTLAAVHGCTGQAFFALMTALCVLTGKKWAEGSAGHPDIARLRPRTAATLVLIYLQVLIGAWLRHFGSPEALGDHAGFALAVTGHALMNVWAIEKRRADYPELVASARALGFLLLAQLAFGIAAWWLLRPFDGIPRFVNTPQALIRTCHQANGALLLASATVLALRAHRSSFVRLSQSTQKPSLSQGEALA